MALKKRKKRGRPPKKASFSLSPEMIRGIAIVALIVLAAISVLGFFEGAGALGTFSRQTIGAIFGWGGFLAPILMIFVVVILVRGEKMTLKFLNYLGIFLLVVSLLGLFHLPFQPYQGQYAVSQLQGGGAVGYGISSLTVSVMGVLASWFVLIGVLLVSIMLTFNISFRSLIDWFKALGEKFSRLKNKVKPEPKVQVKTIENGEFKTKSLDEVDTEAPLPKPVEETELKTNTFTPSSSNADDTAAHTTKTDPNWKFPPLSMLNGTFGKPTSGDIRTKAAVIQKTLSNFGIPVEMSDVSIGPTVTQYTLKPLEGVKLSRITALQNDLALALAAHPIRIEAPIPGKSLVGIEVPNEKIAVVRLRELLESPEWKDSKSKLAIPLGRDVAGNPIIIDIDKMPHLLIAGATGSGKSVCLNAILVSLLYRNSPADLKMILVDPKRVEMSGYNDIPHLLTPVLTDVNKTVNALKWCVAEMDRRYKLLQAAGKVNIKSYNAVHKAERLPYIIVAIDELADLMAVALNDVEGAIVRLAQMARAVGIHLLVSTQRPSVNVITGLIKANITSRIAFNVASQIDSRTIIDMQGAEKLLGNGDLLFVTATASKARRVQGELVEEEEIKRVTEYLRQQGQPDYNEDVPEKDKKPGELLGLSGSGEEEIDDNLFNAAKEEVMRMGKGSASLLQRRLRVGYARAARLLDILEERGIVGPPDGSKPREVLVKGEASGSPPPDEPPN